MTDSKTQKERRKEVLRKLHKASEILDIALAPPRKRIAREWLWLMILVFVAGFALLLGGCSPVQEIKQAAEIETKKVERGFERSARYLEKFKFNYTQLNNGVYLVEFDDHHYLAKGGYDSSLLHTASCPGYHGGFADFGETR